MRPDRRLHWVVRLGLTILLGGSIIARAQTAPPLPSGLSVPSQPQTSSSASDQPTLPSGLEGGRTPAVPALPNGLGEGLTPKADSPATGAQNGFPITTSGFVETRVGVRTQDDPYEKSISIAEARLQLAVETGWEHATLKLTSDVVYDGVVTDHEVQLEKGDGFFDLREASLLLRPTSFMDLKVGRQSLTWGTGDLLFINDLFPKDFRSFLIGRDVDYLKAPSDAIKVSLFSNRVNLDVVYTPRFDADRFIDGRRLSFFNPQLGRRTGTDAVVQADRPNIAFKDDEIAWRVHHTVLGVEWAVYGYHGFWKSPAGFHPISGKATFPPLSVYGASLRGPVARGIANFEFGYYDSEADRSGDDPLVRNSEIRLLVGYERDLITDLTIGWQYQLTHMMHHAGFRRTIPEGSVKADKNQHLFTFRLTQLLLRQKLKLSLFAFYSPSDRDAYLRSYLRYKITDPWTLEIGGNLFTGTDSHTSFSQFVNNSNIYLSLRYSF